MLRRLLSVLGYEPRQEAEPVRHLKRLAEQLNEHAARFRVVVERRVLLEQRVEHLETDWAAWEGRAAKVQPALAADYARVCGRLEGQLQETRVDLATLVAEESFLRNLLTEQRRNFADLCQRNKALGHDVSGCLLYVDLSRPDRVADESLLAADDDRGFLAKIIDSAGVH